MKNYFEHANISVVNPHNTIALILAALPSWHVRGQGNYVNERNETIEWYHVGDDTFYLAIDSQGAGHMPYWTERFTGLNHLGFAVDDLEATIERLKVAGFELDHYGAEHPHRKNAYFIDEHGIQVEFVEYLSPQISERNDYTM
ncbi:lactoylglutathione lyase [Vibrio panuliri]|uniref:Lactoylglutathione lyase n=1 Tax=Vibrio panuliri TaxID=1381081 RepID=A0A1Q9HIT5_9VIBR|nr:VOC family protein [Vibrio panuliri]OLQ90170.1 lactoylglutathione lyase [Vibrio panuliri]